MLSAVVQYSLDTPLGPKAELALTTHTSPLRLSTLISNSIKDVLGSLVRTVSTVHYLVHTVSTKYKTLT